MRRGPHRRFWRRTTTIAVVIGAFSIPATSASAHPTCADVDGLGIEVHGQHVVRDYVIGGALQDWPPAGGAVGQAIAGGGAAVPGGPGPGFHFLHGVAPGASFCNSNARSPGFHVTG